MVDDHDHPWDIEIEKGRLYGLVIDKTNVVVGPREILSLFLLKLKIKIF